MYRRQVIREVRNSEGQGLGVVHAPYDGSVEDAVRIAEGLTNRMHRAFPDASDIQSIIAATDEYGCGKWVIAPNFRSVAEAQTPEAFYIGGDLQFSPSK
jgi:hypothetical protein